MKTTPQSLKKLGMKKFYNPGACFKKRRRDWIVQAYILISFTCIFFIILTYLFEDYAESLLCSKSLFFIAALLFNAILCF